MSLSLDLSAALSPLVGSTYVPPKAISVSDGSGITIEVEVISVESLGMSCNAMRLEIPSLGSGTLDTLKKWATGLCRRVTYLLETLGPLEFDAQGNQVLIRSTQPDKTAGTTKYYQVILSTHGSGRFTLCRFCNDPASGKTFPVPLQLTHEQLSKLVNDLVATLPSVP